MASPQLLIGPTEAAPVGSGSTLYPSLSPQPAFTPSPPTPAEADYDSLKLSLSEDASHGGVLFLAYLDGQLLGSGQVATQNSSDIVETFTFKGHWGAGPHELGIDLIGPDRTPPANLYISSVDYDGAYYSIGAALHGRGDFVMTIPPTS